MTLRLMKASAGGLWIFAVFALFLILSRSTAMPNGIVMAALAILPPILLWFWWNDPELTMSESIHEARDAGGPGTKPGRD